MDYKAIGTRVRRRRIYMNYTQDKLAETVGISTSYLGHIERGSRKMSMDTLCGIAQALECSTDFLLGMLIPFDAILDIADEIVDKAVTVAIDKITEIRMPEEIQYF